MICLQSAQYALQRQQMAVQRILYARSPEESALAERWARAWHRLVQQQLARAHHLRPSGSTGPGQHLH